jgi:pimeloyl-ACP methyl ester carboxylesterase
MATFLLAALGATDAYAQARPPVLFIHGINGTADTWAVLGGHLENAGWAFGGCPRYSPGTKTVNNACSGSLAAGDFYRMAMSSGDGLSLAEQGAEVEAVVATILAFNNTQQVTIVAHSMGGLAARSFIQFYDDSNSVKRLITVGTPHRGADYAELCSQVPILCDDDIIDPGSVAAQDLRPSSAAIQTLNDLPNHPLPATLEAVSIIGTGFPTYYNGEFGDGDGIVAIASQNLGTVGLLGIEHHSIDLFVPVRADAACDHGLLALESHSCEVTDGGVHANIARWIRNELFADDFEDGAPVAWTVSGEESLQPATDGQDNWITSVFSPFGRDEDRLLVGGWGDSYYSMLQFDISGLPATVQTAEVRLWAYPLPGESQPVGMGLYRITSAWNESTKWQTRPTATLIRQLPAPVMNTWYTFDITEVFQGWKTGAFANYGLQLRPLSTNNRFNVFWSSDYGLDSNKRPRLVIRQ